MSLSHTEIKRNAALASISASAALTIAKLIVGLLTGSIGILSEAAHSLIDLGATLITFFAVRISDKPPDRDHPYGHGKIESVAALSETGLLIATSVGIVWEAVRRLIEGSMAVEFSWWAVLVMVLSITIDLIRSRALRAAAKTTKSPALEADALHFASDILSSAIVLIGLGCVALGYDRADSIAAIGVAGFICVAALRLGRRTIDALIDTAPAGIAERVQSIARRTPGVVETGRVRSRIAGATLHVDLEAGVSRRLSLDRMDEVRQDVAKRICAALPGTEIAVSTFPVALDDETLRERILMIAAYHGHPIHHVTVQHVGALLSISLDIEIDGQQTLAQAHETASRLEVAIAAAFGGEVEVETHIEPLMPDAVAGAPASAELTSAVAASIDAIARDLPGVIDTHDVRVRQDLAGLFISFHCALAPEHRIEFVHETVSRIETRLRQQWNAYRIVAHAEPPELETVKGTLAG
jgi:cation diffusion facilitator family transporter